MTRCCCLVHDTGAYKVQWWPVVHVEDQTIVRGKPLEWDWFQMLQCSGRRTGKTHRQPDDFVSKWVAVTDTYTVSCRTFSPRTERAGCSARGSAVSPAPTHALRRGCTLSLFPEIRQQCSTSGSCYFWTVWSEETAVLKTGRPENASCATFPLVELECKLMPLFRGLLEEWSMLAEVSSAGKME